MTREEFVKFLNENNIPYNMGPEIDYDGIYVKSRKEYEMKKKNPRKYRNLYIPYLRVSQFDKERWYTRENGICGYMDKKEVIRKCLELGA